MGAVAERFDVQVVVILRLLSLVDFEYLPKRRKQIVMCGWCFLIVVVLNLISQKHIVKSIAQGCAASTRTRKDIPGDEKSTKENFKRTLILGYFISLKV